MGWEQLLSYYKDNLKRMQEETERRDDPTACPLCGYPLDINAAGIKNCRMGHWRSGIGVR